jgi:hypothetical protein
MSVTSYADDLGSAVHYALETTHAIAICPFHLDLTIRLGDDAAENHAFARARKLVKSDGKTWEGEALRKEFGRATSGRPTRDMLLTLEPSESQAGWGDLSLNRAVAKC